MTLFDQTTLRSHGFAFAPRLTSALESLAARVRARRDRRATRAALAKLTDRELDDIGLTRADIYSRF